MIINRIAPRLYHPGPALWLHNRRVLIGFTKSSMMPTDRRLGPHVLDAAEALRSQSVMAKSTPAVVETSVLEWAPVSAEYAVDETAWKLKFKPKSVENWERGGKWPSIGQVRNMATVYKRPFHFLFLDRPPAYVCGPLDVLTFRQFWEKEAWSY